MLITGFLGLTIISCDEFILALRLVRKWSDIIQQLD